MIRSMGGAPPACGLVAFRPSSKLARKQAEIDARATEHFLRDTRPGFDKHVEPEFSHWAWNVGDAQSVKLAEFTERGCTIGPWTKDRGPCVVFDWTEPLSEVAKWGSRVWWGALARGHTLYGFENYGKKAGLALVDRWFPVDWRSLKLKGGYDCSSSIGWCWEDTNGRAFWPSHRVGGKALDTSLISPMLLAYCERLTRRGEWT